METILFWVILILCYALVCGGLSMHLAVKKGYSEKSWFACGFFFGIFGLIAAAGLPIKIKKKKKKPLGDYTRTDSKGNKFCYNENNQFHNLAGPAVEYSDGDKAYWVNGKRHRTDGPAVEYADGSKEYYVDNKQISEKEFRRRGV